MDPRLAPPPTALALLLLLGPPGCDTGSGAEDDDGAQDDDGADDDGADDDGADDDAADDDSAPAEPGVWLFAGDGGGEVASAYAEFLLGLGLTVTVAEYDDPAAAAAPRDLVVLLSDLPRDADEQVERIVAHGGPVLGLGVGGARAYAGLDVGLGTDDGGQGAVDAMEVDADHTGHPVFAGIDIPADRVVEVTTSAIVDVGIIPSGDVVALAWDWRYPGQYADLCYNDRFWFWGWGGASEGVPDDFTADGAEVFGALVGWLAAGAR